MAQRNRIKLRIPWHHGREAEVTLTELPDGGVWGSFMSCFGRRMAGRVSRSEVARVHAWLGKHLEQTTPPIVWGKEKKK